MEQGPQSSAPLVEVIDATITAPRAHRALVTNVDWRVGPGEFWLVGGRHGAGKTSFLATVAGLRRPGAGVVRHFGKEISQLSEPELLELRQRVGYVFKGGGRMFAGLTVAENVELPLRYHHEGQDQETAARVRAIVEATELASEAQGTAQNLGWDRQQRVGLARALSLNPDVLFLDEPLSGLEARDRAWWRGFLNTLRHGCPLTGGRKMTMIVTTNDFGAWTGETHCRGVLDGGKWRLHGDGKEWPDFN